MEVWLITYAFTVLFLFSIVCDTAADNRSIILNDKTPPIAGTVYDGPVHKKDLKYTKDKDSICSNWEKYYDPESGIDCYMVSVGSQPFTNVTDVSGLVHYSQKMHRGCVYLTEDTYLEHGKTYYTTVWAYNQASRQLNVSVLSDGVIVDLTKPVYGEVVDGNDTSFTDLQFTAATAKLEAQWRGYSDPESTIMNYQVQVQRAENNTEDYEIIRDWSEFDNNTKSVKLLNFHFQHNDRVKIVLRITNGALNSVQNETDGFVVDLTAPLLDYIGDGSTPKEDIDYQADDTTLTANFRFYDDESGMDHYKIQIYELYHGSSQQIYPVNQGEWLILNDPDQRLYTQSGLVLPQGALYSIMVGATNKAQSVVTFKTNGVQIDTSPPKLQWLRVGTLSDTVEEKVDGYVWQADTCGIKASFYATDLQSGVVAYHVAVGTSPGGIEIQGFTNAGKDNDTFIDNIYLQVTNLNTKSPVYYISVKAINGAGLESNTVTSTPIIVVNEDSPGPVP